MFQSCDDYERVVKLLLAAYDALCDYVDPNERPVNVTWDDAGVMSVTWTADGLAHADRYRLDVTQRPGGGYPGGPPPELELRLLVDDGWDPRYADDVDEDHV